jgi:hypothetical protein
MVSKWLQNSFKHSQTTQIMYIRPTGATRLGSIKRHFFTPKVANCLRRVSIGTRLLIYYHPLYRRVRSDGNAVDPNLRLYNYDR